MAPPTALVLLLAACTTPDGTRAAAITNGAPDDGDPAVVAIVVQGSTDTHCTGSLIGPHTVLTAAHCMIDATNFDTYSVAFGPAVAGATIANITDAKIHPGFDLGTLANDFALLTIRETAPAPPLPLDSRTLDASFVGQQFTVVGYGVTSPAAADAGRKRSGTAQVSAVASGDFTATPAPSQPCAIDSGGPALFVSGGQTVVTGVISHGDSACTDHASFAGVDVATAGFITPYLDATAPGSADTGARCFYDAQCLQGPCLQTADEPRLSFCSQPCSGGCPQKMVCAADGCRYPQPSPGAVGWPCTDGSQCSRGLCSAEGLCTRRCNPVGTDCPNGLVCARTNDIDYFCVRPPSDAGCQCALAGTGDLPTGAMVLVLIVACRPGRRRARSRERSRSR